MLAMPAMFAIGWSVTEAAGIDVANQFTVFGVSGLVVFGLLSGLVLMAGTRTQDPASRRHDRSRLAHGYGPGPVDVFLGLQPERLPSSDP